MNKDLVRKAYNVIEDLPGKLNLTEIERNALLVYWFELEIENGGFDQFFFNSAGDATHETVEALDVVGAKKSAVLLSRAIDIWPGKKVPSNRSKRQEMLVDKTAVFKDVFEKLDQEFYAAGEDIGSLLEKYLRARPVVQMDFEVDFKDVKNKRDIIDRLVKVFQLPDASHWDSFMDWFTSLSSDSAVVSNAVPRPTRVHLVLKNLSDVLTFSKVEYKNLLELLDDATQDESRGDGIQFIYSIEGGLESVKAKFDWFLFFVKFMAIAAIPLWVAATFWSHFTPF